TCPPATAFARTSDASSKRSILKAAYSGAPNAAARPDCRTVRRFMGCVPFAYGPGNFVVRASATLTDVPADAAGIDNVNLASQGKLRRRSQFHSREGVLQVLSLQIRPVSVKVGVFECDHLIRLPLRNVDVLE